MGWGGSGGREGGILGRWGVGSGGVGRGGGSGRYEQRSEVFVTIKKINFFFFGGGGVVGSGGEGVRVDVNGEVKFFVKIQKQNIFFWEGGGAGRGDRVDVNG